MLAVLHALIAVLAGGDPLADGIDKVLYRDSRQLVYERDSAGGPIERILFTVRNGVHRGGQFQLPKAANERNRCRDAMHYHHRHGPAGQVMSKFDWFPESDKGAPDSVPHYAADARLPASMIGLAVPSSGQGTLPLTTLLGKWSEPPYAVVGMYVGAMASYARPFQNVDFYENNTQIVDFSRRKGGKPALFRYLTDAKGRGANVRVLIGDARRTLDKKGPQRYYHALFVEICPRDYLEDVSVDLMTTEGVEMLFDKIANEGVLCYHTSNRYVNMVPVLADVADRLKLAIRVGNDGGESGSSEFGRFSSEWVVLARSPQCLNHLRDTGDQVRGLKWTVPVATGKHIWTDAKHPFRGLFHSDPLLVRWLIEPARRIGHRILGRLVSLPDSGVTQEHRNAFNRAMYQMTDTLSRTTLELRYRLESWTDDDKK
jgi:hypothetical protein